jgi:hypothetical protein
MKDLIQQIRAANRNGLYYVALFTALALPDICGGLEAPDGLATRARYIAWFDKNVALNRTRFLGTRSWLG